jgi:hypothetical protein
MRKANFSENKIVKVLLQDVERKKKTANEE